MNFNFYRSKFTAFLIIALPAVAILVLIFLTPSPPPANKSSYCHQTNLPYQNPTLPVGERVADLLSRMTDAEKIGQMVLIEKNSINLKDVTQYNIGALLSGGGAGPKQDTPLAWLEMIHDFQSAAK
ncbi:MAG: hypothetical protein Q8P07_04615, partial [bacterium]|nr:hypothetical protein [bacterium]